MTTKSDRASSLFNGLQARRDTPPPLHYPIHDTRTDAVSSGTPGSYYLPNPSNFNDSVVYNAITRSYTVYEKIGTRYYRVPTTYSFDEFWAMRNRQAEIAYFQKRANTTNILNRGKFLKPKLSLSDHIFNSLFGNGKIDITLQGNVDITAGYKGQTIENPTVPERGRKITDIDFNVKDQFNGDDSIYDNSKFHIK